MAEEDIKQDNDNIEDDETPIVDELGSTEDMVVPVNYSISSYGADFDVYGLVRRIQNGDIYIPPFQRKFIWNLKQSSRFIESLLLGLPIPSIFLSRDDDNKLLVIDGQQRLRTLQYFYQGFFEKPDKNFALNGVQDQYQGKTYNSLIPEERRKLDDSILHTFIIRQDEPSDDNTSVYYIFERLNTTGTPLTHQEIRASIYRGKFNDLLEKLNQNPFWRSIYGRVNKRRRDQEFILRFFALYFNSQAYFPPMKEFLNKYMIKNRHLPLQSEDKLSHLFANTIETIYKYIGTESFRPFQGLNTAVFDAVMVAVARRLEKGSITNGEQFKKAYETLLENTDFLKAIETGTTAGAGSVSGRIREATRIFQDVK
jgi:hypothetical protein